MTTEQQHSHRKGAVAMTTTGRSLSAIRYPISNLQSRSTTYAEALVLLIAALTRFWRLDYHSIWFDEAVSLRWAGMDASFTWQKTFPLLEDKHPPFYYLGLHAWQRLAGLFGWAQSDVALRAFGSLLGVLTVWGILLLAHRLSGRATGLLTGLLVALSPVLVWYSQELRMFQPATTGVVWASYCMLRAWQTDKGWPRAGWWLGFIVASEAALYSYLFSAFMLPTAGFALLALFFSQRITPDRWRRFAAGVVALAMAGALFLPLAYNAWMVNSNEGTPGQAFADLSATLGQLLRIFTIWRVDWPIPFVTAALALFALLLIAGLGLPAHKSTSVDRIWLLLWIGTPLLIGNLLLSRDQSVFREDRYFIFVAPFVLWAIARGIVLIGQRWRVVGWISSVVTVALLLTALPRLWTPAMDRENWRAAAAYLVDYQRATPGLPSTVVAHVDYTHDALEWYVRQTFDFATLPIFFPYGGTLTPEQVETVIAPPLQGIVDTGTATLWLTQSHLDGVDDGRLVEGWLNQNFPLITEQYPAGIKLTGYALQSQFAQLPPLAAGAVYPAAELAPGLTLTACEVLTPRLAAQDAHLHPPSGWVHVRLWWQTTGAIQDDYIASAQMVGAEGVWGERLYRANEALRRWPTRTWALGKIVRDEVDINLNPATPPGEYPIMIGVMDSNGQSIGEKVVCGQATID